ncbi:CoA-transferase [Streptomyces sp. R39]|uniref:CoA-transferase n=1 Tax=Streptomyces sp. R39 TaxID=3238631 RepID=A0AB39R595_9ACTN
MASAADAVADIPEGASPAVGGFGLCGIPAVLIGALLARHPRRAGRGPRPRRRQAIGTPVATGATLRDRQGPPRSASGARPAGGSLRRHHRGRTPQPWYSTRTAYASAGSAIR